MRIAKVRITRTITQSADVYVQVADGQTVDDAAKEAIGAAASLEIHPRWTGDCNVVQTSSNMICWCDSVPIADAGREGTDLTIAQTYRANSK